MNTLQRQRFNHARLLAERLKQKALVNKALLFADGELFKPEQLVIDDRGIRINFGSSGSSTATFWLYDPNDGGFGGSELTVKQFNQELRRSIKMYREIPW